MNNSNFLEVERIKHVLQNIEKQSYIKGEFRPAKFSNDQYLDGQLTLKYKDKSFSFNTEIKNEVREYMLKKIVEHSHDFAPLIVIATTISVATKEKLRNKGISYIDGAGNIFHQYEGGMIWIEGHKSSAKTREMSNRAFTKAGLKVIYMFLNYPESINLPYREIAVLSNVAIGTITSVFAGLKSAGYIIQINDKKVTLQNKRELLERWQAGYLEILKPSLFIGTYQLRKNIDWRNILLPEATVWGGESAAEILTNHLNAEIFTIYTAGATTSLTKQLQIVPSAKGNLEVYQKFWQDQTEDGVNISPAIIIYADLMSVNDPRCTETAEMILKNQLQHIIKNNE